MTTLFGPQLLVRPSEPSVHGGDTRGLTPGRGATVRDRLTAWQPPVCVLLLPGLELQLQEHREDPSVPVSDLVRLTNPQQGAYAQHCNGADLRYYIQPFQDDAQLREHTTLIGRIFIRDLDTDRHLHESPQSPELTAQFHHNLVMMARQAVQKPILDAAGHMVQGAYADLADRIDCWVIVNEPQLDAEAPSGRLTRLAQYEKARLRLAGPTYNCGLFAFSTAQPAQKLAHWQQPAVQEALDAANDQNRDHGTHHLVLIHQYFKPDNAEDVRDGDHSFHTRTGAWVQGTTLTAANRQHYVQRFEHFIYPWFRTAYPHLKVVVSEYGADGRIGLDPARYAPQPCPSAGWKEYPAWHSTYLPTLQQLEVYSRPYSDVIVGYCLFALGEYYDSRESAGEFWTYRLDAGPGRDRKGEATILEDLISHARSWQTRPPGTLEQPGTREWLEGAANTAADSHFLYYGFRRARGTVTCTLASSRSPVKSYAHRATPLCTVPPGFRPERDLTPHLTGAWVDAAGAPQGDARALAFTLTLGTNGEVRYGDVSHLPSAVAFLSYQVQVEWGLPGSARAAPGGTPGAAWAQLLPAAGRVYASVHVGAPGTVELQPSTRYVPVGWHDPQDPVLNPHSRDLQILLSYPPRAGTALTTTGGDALGWVPGAGLELQGPWGDVPGIPLLRVSSWVTAGANVRTGPDTKYEPPLRWLPPDGVWYPVVGKNAEQPAWWRIELAAGVHGWVHGSLVDLHGSETVPVAGPGTGSGAKAGRGAPDAFSPGRAVPPFFVFIFTLGLLPMPLSPPVLLPLPPDLQAAQPRTVLWVDSAGDARQPACKLLAAHHITVHCVDSFAEALGQIPRLHPHLLLLAYPPAAAADMRYETFVYTELPRVDPYRPQGPWAVNPWHYTEIPILLQAADLAPGCLAPLLHRAYPLSTPYEPCLLLPRVQALLPPPPPGLILDADHQRIWWQGRPHRVPPRGLDILYLLARSHPRPLTAAQLARQLRDTKGVRTTDTQVRMAIRRLRQSLPAGHPDLIANHRPGYSLTQAPADLAGPRREREYQ